MTEPMVPNPRHLRLRELLAEAEQRAVEVRTAYRRVVQAMQSGKVWTGPAATAWTEQVDDRHRRLARLAQQVVDAVEDELRRHPPLVTRAQADAARRELAGRL
ncbi:hypothetical protein ACFFMN_26430 [Planobispora siamensis]|uniref:Uncharacterized protein n=1 Tax=Planobispora siamensis TaxID=936338 RepID=A0A8J3WJL3_9ACTN|nr:hypothetical protein [Planobispora siamensis]GIH90797.1 hypothetical protein Psi01_14270 [Planobispora siamensis]